IGPVAQEAKVIDPDTWTLKIHTHDAFRQATVLILWSWLENVDRSADSWQAQDMLLGTNFSCAASERGLLVRQLNFARSAEQQNGGYTVSLTLTATNDLRDSK